MTSLTLVEDLPSFPDSWYSVGFANQLKPRCIISAKICGLEIVIFRTESGRIQALDAHCPHLGAHLGEGGQVIEESIQCPFHGFQFNGQGKCTKTGYGTEPTKRLCIKSYPVEEVNGFILIYYSKFSRAPSWNVPAVDHDGWSKLESRVIPVQSHVQELKENAVDIGHFAFVHKYVNIESLRPVIVDKEYLSSHIAFDRKNILPGDGEFVHAEIMTHSYGMGYTLTETFLPDWNIRIRHYIAYLPRQKKYTDIHIASQVHGDVSGIKKNILLKFLPTLIVQKILSMAVIKTYKDDVMDDVQIWENKKYLSSPAVIKGDGPINTYRKYSSIFYPEYNNPDHEELYKIAS